jgi:hypothetical protein
VANVTDNRQAAGFAIITTTGSQTIRLDAQWSQSSGTPTGCAIDSGAAGRTKVGYARLG